MTKLLEKVFDDLSHLSDKEQNAIAALIQDELLWDISLKNSKKELSKLAQESIKFKLSKKDILVSDKTLSVLYKGTKRTFDLTKLSSRLAKATKAQRENYALTASGYGIRWNDLDEDISLYSLLEK
jgi:hypothetical protein